MAHSELCFLTATELAARIRARELSAREVMEAHLAQIERVNPTVNAIVTLLPERALAGARAADEVLAGARGGGSSGGAAVALACGMLPLADGSDLGGSLRNPASFCNVVGFRTAPGRVPVYPTQLGWWTLSVVGPMARTVQDVALMLSAIAGPDP